MVMLHQSEESVTLLLTLLSNKKETNNMKLTCPGKPNANVPNANHIPLACVGSFCWVFGIRVGSGGVGVGFAKVFRYQHGGIGDLKWLRRGSKPKQGRNNANGFAF